MSSKELLKIAELQDVVLKTTWEIARERFFWKLSGGTALTKFHGFKHRFSKDLDFFWDAESEVVKKIFLEWERLIRKKTKRYRNRNCYGRKR